ncbi:MAG TPA: hypothetical protein PLS31_12775 [Candidatus Sumerlaeota bacterium]|nr:hypothetical protein [Candidatus Sumerlaeota bacterium]
MPITQFIIPRSERQKFSGRIPLTDGDVRKLKRRLKRQTRNPALF